MKFLKEGSVVFIFALISLLFCFPQLKGKVLSEADNIQWKCMAHEAITYHESTGKDVLWSNSMYGGMPTFTTYIGASTTNYVGYAQSLIQALGKPAYFFFVYLLGFYILLRVLKVNKWLSVAGAIAYGFTTFNVVIVTAGHETQALSLGYLPAALAGLLLIFNGKRLYGAALFALPMALLAGNNHVQVMFYTCMIFLAYTVYMFIRAVRQGELKSFFVSAVLSISVGMLCLGPNITYLLTTKEYASSTIRGGKSELAFHDKKVHGGLDKDVAFKWSSGIGETFVILIPYLYGGASFEPAVMAPKTAAIMQGSPDVLPVYWGSQSFIQGPVYFGAAVCFLFVLGLLLLKSGQKWWMLGISVFGFMLSWGNNFKALNYFLFDYGPLFNMFRAVTMANIIPQFLFPVVAMLTLQQIIVNRDDKKNIWNKVKIAGGITIGICLLVGLGGSLFLSYTSTADSAYPEAMVNMLKQDRASLTMVSAFKSAFFIAVAGALIWAFINNKIKEVVFIASIGCIFVIDLLPVAFNYLNEHNYLEQAEYDAAFEPRDVDKEILKDKDPYYRVLDLSGNPFTNSTQAYFHKCVGGNNPAIMEKYNDLIQRQMINGFNESVVNMLNTKYIILKNPAGAPFVQTNPNACGNAWFVNELKWVENDEEAMQALKAGHLGDTTIVPDPFQPLKTAVVRTKFKPELGDYHFSKDSTSMVKLDEYGLDEISFKSFNKSDGLAVFSDIYYSKGWKAYVDGKETPIVRTDYVLRAIKVPAGAHKILFEFRPDSFYKFRPVSIASSILLIFLMLGSVVVYFRSETAK